MIWYKCVYKLLQKQLRLIVWLPPWHRTVGQRCHGADAARSQLDVSHTSKYAWSSCPVVSTDLCTLDRQVAKLEEKDMESICGKYMAWFFMAFHSVSIKVMLEMFKCWCNVLLLSFCPCTPGGFDPILWLHGNLHAIARENNHCHLAINHDLITWMGCHDLGHLQISTFLVVRHMFEMQFSKGIREFCWLSHNIWEFKTRVVGVVPMFGSSSPSKPDQPSTPQATQELGELGFLQFMAMLDHSRSRPHFSTFGFGGNMWNLPPKSQGIFPAGRLPSLWSLQLFGGSGGWGTGFPGGQILWGGSNKWY